MGSRGLPSTAPDEVGTETIEQAEDFMFTLRKQYRNVVLLENKCIWLHKNRPQSTVHLPSIRWQDLLTIPKQLLHEHEHFIYMSRMPSASAIVREIPFSYAMFGRMWRYGIHSTLELLRQNLPDTLVHMLSFIDFVSSTLKRVLLFDSHLGVTLYEQLGDLTRYRMAVGKTQDREDWAVTSRYWYQKAADRNPEIGRIQHSLAILSHSDALQKFFYLTKAWISVQSLPVCHSRATIDKFFDHWNTLAFQRGSMVAQFVVLHSILLTDISGERIEILTNDFISLLAVQIQHHSCRKQHGVYIMSCNIASVLGYGTAVYPHMADLFSMKQSSVTANGSASAKKSSTDLSLQSKMNQAFPAIRLTFQTLSVLLRYSNYPGVVAGIHFSLAFLWSVSFHSAIMRSLGTTAPWRGVTEFLNSLLSHNADFSRIEDERFPIGDDKSALQLPEDFLIRGQVWSQSYYPDNFFYDASGYGYSIDKEGSEEEVRRYRCLWLGVQIATRGRWITYSSKRTRRFELANTFAERYAQEG